MTVTTPRPDAPANTPGRQPSGRTPVRSRRSITARRDNRAGLIMVAPTLIIVIAVIIVPIIWNVLLAFQNSTYLSLRTNGLFGEFTLDNFTAVFTDPTFWSSLLTTVIYSVLGTAGSIALGLIAALAFRAPFRGRGIFRAMMLLPYVAPVVAVTFVWQIMLNPQFGIVNAVGTQLLGWSNPINFLGKAPYALTTVILFEIWRYFPFAFLFITARLTALPRDIEEAAIVDGATPTQSFRHIVLPQLMPVIALLSMLRLIMNFNKFDDVYLLTGGNAGTEVSAVRVFNVLVGNSDIGGAAANALILSVILGVALFIYVKFFANRTEES
jgi:ABC-type sugar transport system permease subunit